MTVCMFPESNDYMNCSKCPHETCTLRNIPAESQPSEPDKVKPLAQYLAEYVQYEGYGHELHRWGTIKWHELLEQALDAYESTEQVKIRVEPV